MKRAGFTLIELSIVLVIIGLISASVLVGRDLIKAAELRAVVSQLQDFNTTIQTFQLKYQGLPGDLVADKAESFGFLGLDNSPSQGFGDDNRLIQSGALAGVGAYGPTGETVLLWRHLTEAKLIAGVYGQTIDPVSGDAVIAPDTNIRNHLPPSKIGKDR
jgi:prepilin-type N-terminal cleavage/methylation domain-containing protein